MSRLDGLVRLQVVEIDKPVIAKPHLFKTDYPPARLAKHALREEVSILNCRSKRELSVLYAR